MIIKGGFLTMGTKRVGMARVKSLINENVNQMKIFKQEQISLVHNVTSNHTLTEAQSGAVLFWEHGGAHDITLPDAKAGMYYKFILKVGSGHAQNIVSQANDKIYGKVFVSTNNAADKCSVQTLAKGSAVDKVKLHSTTTTLGGNIGDVIELYCYEAGFWTCDARLTVSGGNPGSTAVLAN
jgi:hypothetical protein